MGLKESMQAAVKGNTGIMPYVKAEISDVITEKNLTDYLISMIEHNKIDTELAEITLFFTIVIEQYGNKTDGSFDYEFAICDGGDDWVSTRSTRKGKQVYKYYEVNEIEWSNQIIAEYIAKILNDIDDIEDACCVPIAKSIVSNPPRFVYKIKFKNPLKN